MEIINQPLSISRISYYKKCKKKFKLDILGTVPKDRHDSFSPALQAEHKKIKQLFLSLRATSQPIPSGRHNPTTTNTLINNNQKHISEAAFSLLETTASFPLIHLTDNKNITIYDLKPLLNLKRTHIESFAIKCSILQQAGYHIQQAIIVLLNPKFTYQGDGNYHGLFIEKDITQDIHHATKAVPAYLQTIRQDMLSTTVPTVNMNKRCSTPTPCYYLSHCTQQQPTNTNKPTLNLNKIAQALKQLPHPWYFFDIEAISFMLPRWQHCKPFEKIPFQFSCHIQPTPNAPTTHKEFIDVSGNYPIQAFSQAITNTITTPGTILVYDLSLERQCLQLCQQQCPELATQLSHLDNQLTDLLPIVRSAINQPNDENDNKISLRLKSIVNMIDPNLSYQDLASVKNGNEAQHAYLHCVNNQDSNNHQQLQTEMTQYCKRDTEVLVALINKAQQAKS